MQRDPRAFLWDVCESALAIQGFMAGMNADAYAASDLVQAGVERKFEIIGEVLTRYWRDIEPAGQAGCTACSAHTRVATDRGVSQSVNPQLRKIRTHARVGSKQQVAALQQNVDF